MQSNHIEQMHDRPPEVTGCTGLNSENIFDNQNILDVAMILLSGVFRQIFPIITRSTITDKLNEYLKS